MITRQKRKSRKKNKHKIHFSIFIENQNSDLKFAFQLDNENENRKKKLKFNWTLKLKSNFPFNPGILICSDKLQCSVIAVIEKPFSFMFCVLTSVLNENQSFSWKSNQSGLGTVGI